MTIELAWLGPDSAFPPLTDALKEPNGLLCGGGDLSVERLVEAYSQGIFPWFSPGDPVLWWSPDPRMVLSPSEFKQSRSLSKVIRNSGMEVHFNRDFSAVIKQCALPRDDQGEAGTWITTEMVDAYIALHQAGYAHSVETWLDGQLVGGLYGVAIGKVFFGESMFSLASNASKVAMAALCQRLAKQGFEIIDCQMNTSHLASLGAKEIGRDEFSRIISKAIGR